MSKNNLNNNPMFWESLSNFQDWTIKVEAEPLTYKVAIRQEVRIKTIYLKSIVKDCGSGAEQLNYRSWIISSSSIMKEEEGD